MKMPKRDVQESSGGGGVFLKLGDGESVTGVFRGEVYTFYSYWDQASRRSVVVDLDHDMARPRYRLNFITKDESGQLAAKIWEFAGPVYDMLQAINEEYALEETTIKVTRKGEGKETEYNLLPLLKTPLTPKALEQIAAVKLQVLNHKDAPVTEKKTDPFP